MFDQRKVWFTRHHTLNCPEIACGPGYEEDTEWAIAHGMFLS
jgi:hypothetical protein